jgi:Fic family protein
MGFLSTFHKFYAYSPEAFAEDYHARRHSPGSFIFSYPLAGPDSFFCYDKEVIALCLTLAAKNAKLQDAYASLSRLGQESLVRSLFLNDVAHSNAIEGLSSTVDGLFKLLLSAGKKPQERFSLIVAEYSLLAKGEGIPCATLQDIRNLYDRLIGRLDGESAVEPPDGQLFRKGSVGIYDEVNPEPLHVGAPNEESIAAQLQQALAIMATPNLDFFVRSALFHFLFESIHPFYDGNGRTGRFILSLQYRQELGEAIPFALSAAIAKRRPAYYRAFKETMAPQNKGDLTTFVYPFLSIVDEAYDGLLASLQSQGDKKARCYEAVASCRFSTSEKRLLTALIEASLYGDFGLTVEELSQQGQASPATTNRFLSKLKKTAGLSIARFGKKDYFLFRLPLTSL